MNVCELTPLPRARANHRRFGVHPHDRRARVARRLQHRKYEIVVPDAVDDHDIEIGQPLDVLRPRLIIAGVDIARQQRTHFVARQIADDVGGPGIVRMERDADLSGAAGFAVCAFATAANKTTRRTRANLNTEARATRRARAKGVSRENTGTNTRPSDAVRSCIRACVSRAAGRFAAGELDASPQSPLTQPAEKCIFSARPLWLRASVLRQRCLLRI